jgi:hypothetical protein
MKTAISPSRQPKTEPSANSIHFLDEDLAFGASFWHSRRISYTRLTPGGLYGFDWFRLSGCASRFAVDEWSRTHAGKISWWITSGYRLKRLFQILVEKPVRRHRAM